MAENQVELVGEMPKAGLGEKIVSVPRLRRTVVIAVDHSQNSAQSIAWAAKNFLKADSDHVILLHVKPEETVPIVVKAAYTLPSEEFKSQSLHNIQAAEELLEKYANELRELAGPVEIQQMIRESDDPKHEICKLVKEQNAAALIIASRGLSNVKRLLLGSVADHCVHHVHCTVIVPKTKKLEWKKE
ncbi:MAG: hypothetical protein SGCHY_004473 [Lobulomycetales sp.]